MRPRFRNGLAGLLRDHGSAALIRFLIDRTPPDPIESVSSSVRGCALASDAGGIWTPPAGRASRHNSDGGEVLNLKAAKNVLAHVVSVCLSKRHSMNTKHMLDRLYDRIKDATGRMDLPELTRLSKMAQRVQGIQAQMDSLIQELRQVEN